MIERFYLEDYLSFNKLELEFEKGLIVFTGPSGAGKSILFNAFVSLFGISDATPKLAELNLDNLIQSDDYIIDDELVLKLTKTTKTRYFINNQSIAKSALTELTKPFFKHLHLKDTSDFDNEKILEFLDFLASKDNLEYAKTLEDFYSSYKELKNNKQKFNKILEDEKNIEDLKEFTKFEIEKIASINPGIDEYEELKDLKNIFTKKEKLESTLDDAKPIIENSYKISQALETLDIDSSFFDDAINEVNNHFEKFYDSLNSIEDVNLDDTMQRLDDLQKLIKKYGSIEEAIEYKKQKELELEKFENITFEKEILLKNIKKLESHINSLADLMSFERINSIKLIQKDMDKFVSDLYLSGLKITRTPKELDETGIDTISFALNNVELKKLSSGEFNRLRLALLTTRSLYETSSNGILFLDEIDANLSGKESESIGKVLQQLSQNYQIFAISHQPQLSSLANQHFLVEKNEAISRVREIFQDDRIKEISRMISGENITPEAIEFAKKLLVKESLF